MFQVNFFTFSLQITVESQLFEPKLVSLGFDFSRCHLRFLELTGRFEKSEFYCIYLFLSEPIVEIKAATKISMALQYTVTPMPMLCISADQDTLEVDQFGVNAFVIEQVYFCVLNFILNKVSKLEKQFWPNYRIWWWEGERFEV